MLVEEWIRSCNTSREQYLEFTPLIKEIARKIDGFELSKIDEWSIYHDGKLLDKIIDKFVERVKRIIKNGDKISHIGGIGESGAPIAYNVGYRMNLPVIIINEKYSKNGYQRKFLPEPRSKDNNVKFIVFDSSIKTSLRAVTASKLCKESNHDIHSIFTMILNSEFFNVELAKNIKNIHLEPILIWNSMVREDYRSGKEFTSHPLFTKNEKFKCPSCKKHPPKGDKWVCNECKIVFDTFETRATCPNKECGMEFSVTSCTYCHALNNIEKWKV